MADKLKIIKKSALTWFHMINDTPSTSRAFSDFECSVGNTFNLVEIDGSKIVIDVEDVTVIDETTGITYSPTIDPIALENLLRALNYVPFRDQIAPGGSGDLQDVLNNGPTATFNGGDDFYSFLPTTTSWGHANNTNGQSEAYFSIGNNYIQNQSVLPSDLLTFSRFQITDNVFSLEFLKTNTLTSATVAKVTLKLSEEGLSLMSKPSGDPFYISFKTNELTTDVEREYANVSGIEVMSIKSKTANASGEVDLDDKYVPLTGTITAQPITGNIEVEENDKVFFTKASNYPDDYNSIGFAQSGVYLNYKNDITLESSRLSVGGENFIEVFSNKPNFQGINGYHDYSANYTANSYVQKTYVDGLVGGATNLSYTPSATNGVVNSDTGTDATIPLGNGTNAGLSLNDYTTAEKSKLASTPTSFFNGAYSSLTGIPSTFTPSTHSHVISDVTSLQTTLDGKQPLSTVLTNTTASFTTADETKVDFISITQPVNLDTLESDTNTNNAKVSNATHTGDVTGSTALTLATVNSNVGTFNRSNITVNAKGLVTAVSSGFTKNFVEWYNTNASAGIWLGTAGLGAGTFAAVWPSDTNLYTSLKKSQYSNVLTTANQILGQRNSETIFFRGSSVSGAGGFTYFARGGMTTWTNGGRFFTGMATATGVLSSNPSLLANTVGFATDDSDAGLISFITRSATTLTKVSTGFTWASNQGYDFEIFCAPNGSEYTWKITSLQTGATVTGTANTNLPVNNTKQLVFFGASNAALTPVNSIQIGINRITIETNY